MIHRPIHMITLLCLILVLGMTSASWSATPNPNTSDTPEPQPQTAGFLQSALENQIVEVDELRETLERLQRQKGTIDSIIAAYDSESNAHNQLLLVSRVRLESLENAVRNNRRAVKNLTARLELLKEQSGATEEMMAQTEELIELARKQPAVIRTSPMPGADKRRLGAIVQELIRVLSEKKRLGDRYGKLQQDLISRLTAVVEEKTALGERLGERLEGRKKDSLFTRTHTYSATTWKTLTGEVEAVKNDLAAAFTKEFWEARWAYIKLSGFAPSVTLVVLLAVLLALQGRWRASLQQAVDRWDTPEWYYRRLAISLIKPSLPYLVIILVFLSYNALGLVLVDIYIGYPIYLITMVLLITRWGLDYLDQVHGDAQSPVGSFVYRRLSSLLRIFRAVGIFIVLVNALSGKDSLVADAIYDLAAAGLLLWTVFFWRRFAAETADAARDGHHAPDKRRIMWVRGWSYLVSGGALLISLAGYNALAEEWGMAWVRTLAVLFWGWLTFKAIQERHHEIRMQIAKTDKEHPPPSGHYVRWSMVQIIRILWFFVLVNGIIWAWDKSGTVISHVSAFLSFTYTIGTLTFSITGILLAAVIIFLTYATVRVGQALLNERVLEKKTYEPGFKDSIITVVGYLGWGLGLVLALGVMGVNTTSLAVVFGALSVGIGFGLNTIFNNFISGLILLFERPIQVGDYVEVGGLWAEVKKINVRATVVQTFDNAAVIIPNSEFISARVTNWSFKDKRMRRLIDVGVAYGSDIDLVEKTLLEVAANRKRVLKHPKPDVLFIDHADSALIFRLRMWVHVDNYWWVASDIRKDIDRRFRELGIEIAFPQRDLHLRTIPKEFRSRASGVDVQKDAPPEDFTRKITTDDKMDT